jgi:hypothetical protein
LEVAFLESNLLGMSKPLQWKFCHCKVFMASVLSLPQVLRERVTLVVDQGNGDINLMLLACNLG